MTKTKKKQETSKLKSYIKGIVLIFIISMSLIHVFYDQEYKKLKDHRDTYKPIITERKEIEMYLLMNLKNGNISKDEYIASLLSHKKLYTDKVKTIIKKKSV
jgi:p-aminobenzoyl-glutamate transporter AbgT